MKKTFLPALVLAVALALSPSARAGETAPDPPADLTGPLVPAPLFPQEGEAPAFTDVAGSWCEGYVTTVCRTGLMKGRSATVFDAETPLTNAQIVVIIARLHNLLQGQSAALPEVAPGHPWFQSAVDLLRQAYPQGVVSLFLAQLYDAYDPILPEAVCSRERFVQLLAAVVPKDVLTPLNQISLVLDTNDPAILSFYQAGIVSGSDAYGTFRGASPLTRGAAAALLARLSDPSLRMSLAIQPFDLCRDVLDVSPETVLLTAQGQEISAELFAPQLCLSLYQWQGSPRRALANACTLWCSELGPYHVLAQEMDVALSEEELASCAAQAEATHGLYGQRAAYRRYVQEGQLLSQRMQRLYAQQGSESSYSSLLAQRSKALETALRPTQALEDLDLSAVYERLMASPLYR